MEVWEIVVGKDVVEGKGGREAHCKPTRPTAQASGGALLFHPHLPLPPSGSTMFFFYCFEILNVGCISRRCGDTYSFLVSARVDGKGSRLLPRTNLAQGLGPL